MNRFASFPAWVSAALLVASAATFALGTSTGQNQLWQTLLFLVQALMLSSFVAAFIATQCVWRASPWLAGVYVVVSLFASWCLYVGQLTIADGIDGGGHPVGIVIGAAIGFLFIPASGVAAGIAAVKGDAAGFSARTKVCGLAAALIGVSGLILVIPVSRMFGTEYGVVITFLSLGGVALIGWWVGLGVTARHATVKPTPPRP